MKQLNQEKVEKIILKRIEKSGDFYSQINKFLNGMLPNGQHLYLGRAKDILSNVDIEDYFIIIEQSKLSLIMKDGVKNGHSHGISRKNIEMIIKELKDPLYILISSSVNESLVIVTNLKDNYNRLIIITIKINEKCEINNIYFFAHKVTSIYGKNNIEKFLMREKFKGNILFTKEKNR